MVLMVCVIVLSGCAASTSDSSIQIQEETVELGETSFDLSLATFEYDKEKNDLLIEYDTGLPDQTEVIIGLNPGFPQNSDDLYREYYNYAKSLNQEVNAVVNNGKISYNITDQEFGSYKLPSGTYYLRVVIPMSETQNPSFYEQIKTEEEFLAIYPNGELLSEEQPTYYSFFDRDEEIERWIYFYDESVSLENAHSLDEIQDSFVEVDYREIDKNPSKFEGERVEFTGTVLEIHESHEGMLNYHAYLRLDVGINDVIYVDYYSALGTDGLFEDDVVTLQGQMTGSKTYESVAGHQITIPSMEAVTYLKQ